MQLFAQIRKVDEEKRLVFGRLAQEAVDKSDEIMDYASSKPHFVKWSEDMARDTDGKSLGNLRAMHGKVAAGKFTQIDFNDADKAIDVCAKVVDDGEWKKVLEGVYTGFSIGGSYVGDKKVEKADGRDVTRYTAKPNEGSLVDRPCIPSARFFEVQKADGSLRKVEFKALAADAGDVTVNGTAEEIAALGKLMNEHGLSLAELVEKAVPAFIKDKIDAKKDGKGDAAAVDDEKGADGKPKKKADGKPADKAEPSGELQKLEVGALRKNFYSCAELAQLLLALQNLKSSASWSAYTEGDKSAAPARIGAVIALAGQVLKEMIDEELAEVGADASLALSEKAAGLAKFEGDPVLALLKIGARNSSADTARLAKIHEMTVELGHACTPAAEKLEPAVELTKLDAGALQKLVADAVAPLSKALGEAQAEIKKLDAQPAPVRISLRAVSKSDDLIDDPLAKMAEPEVVTDSRGEKQEAAALIKSLHKSGGAPLTKFG